MDVVDYDLVFIGHLLWAIVDKYNSAYGLHVEWKLDFSKFDHLNSQEVRKKTEMICGEFLFQLPEIES